MFIKQLAKKSNVHIKTVRYYEKRGLIPKPPRTESGYRNFPEQIVSRIRFIKRVQELGFSLREIAELLSLSNNPEAGCKEVKQQTDNKIKNIDAKINDLQKIKKALSNLSVSCSGKGSLNDCPILDALNNREANDPE